LFSQVIAALLFAVVHATAAVVGPAGYTNGFIVRPPTTDWATLSLVGGSGDAYSPDATVNASVSASGVTAQTVSDAGNPPAANASAAWSSTGLYLQTRPTMNLATVLMGKFVNNTGTNATQITLSYLFTIAAGGVSEENGRGTRFYFSLTGQTHSWTNVPALNTTVSTDGSSTLSASISLNWTNGGSLFVLWLDDNAGGGTDAANQFDNVSLRVAAGTLGTPNYASVGPAGYSNGFGAQPTTDWATLNIAGGSTDNYNPDAEVNASVSVSSVMAQTVFDAGNPPVANASATWSSTGRYLQTRPTGNRATVLMGKFVNHSGTNATQITLSYLFTIAAGGASEEDGRGTRFYFSLTGQANSWTNVPALNTSDSTDGSFALSASISMNWTNGGSLFLAWFDDNSGDGTDSANQYDDFSLRLTAGMPTNFFCLVSAPSHNATLLPGPPVIATALTANATAPYTVEYFTNGGVGNTIFASAGASGTASYNVSLGNLPLGTYRIYAVSTDSAGVPLSTNSVTNTFAVADPIVFTLTAPSDDSIFAHTNPVLCTTTIIGGTAPYSVQFYFDNLPDGMAVASPPYERNLGGLPVGDHTIRATVTDARGWVSNSLVHTVHITGPLAASLAPANGSEFGFGTNLLLTATLAGGEAPYAMEFYVNGQVAGSLSSPPFTMNAGVLPAGSYTCYVHATDSSVPPQQARSSTNRITILPRLRVMPLGDSITYGLGASGGYRAPLYQLLTNAGYSLDFIGTQTGNGAASLPDPNHEGYPGAFISDIDSVVSGLFSAAMEQEPDIMLLLVGINDYLNNVDTPHATNRLEDLVERIAINWPNARLVVASLTEVSESLNTQVQTTFNTFLPSICERQRGLGRQVYFTDMHSAVPLADMPDRLHPNQLGYRKMATNWFTAINALPLPCANCPPTFTLQPTNQLVLPGANVRLVAAAAGTGSLRYQWFFEGTSISNATNRSYTFANVSLTNGHGNFSVVVSNNVGIATSTNAFVFVRINPGIVSLPAAQTVLQGRDVTFTCIATGAPPLFYSWIRNGIVEFTNTTGIGMFTNVQASATNPGIRCDVRNAAAHVSTPDVHLIMIPDFDGDGISDAWELQYGFSITNAADALLDFDGDGMSNRDEYLSGTEPTDAGSVMKLTFATSNVALLEFVARSNIAYSVQFRTSLVSGSWNNLTNLNAQSQTRTVLVDAALSPLLPERYYRLVTPQIP
jgi:lysophospholipase L1-like esterase